MPAPDPVVTSVNGVPVVVVRVGTTVIVVDVDPAFVRKNEAVTASGCPRGTFPKSRRFGTEMASAAGAPVPVSVRVRGLPGPLSVTVIVAVRLPVALGVNFRSRKHRPPPGTVMALAQVLLPRMAKSPAFAPVGGFVTVVICNGTFETF